MRSSLDKLAIDQAEGLRRMLARSSPRVVAVVGGSAGVGSTSTVLNLAAVLSKQGREVLVVDENYSHLLTAATSSERPRERNGLVVASHRWGFSVLDSTRPGNRGDALCRAVFDGNADIVLIDARADDGADLSDLARRAHEVMLVTRTSAHAIIDAYSRLKRLHYAHAIGRFKALVTHVRDASEAQTVFDNLASAAVRYLAVTLENAGRIAADPCMHRALELSRSIDEAFPATPAARDIRRLADEIQDWPARTGASTE